MTNKYDVTGHWLTVYRDGDGYFVPDTNIVEIGSMYHWNGLWDYCLPIHTIYMVNPEKLHEAIDMTLMFACITAEKLCTAPSLADWNPHMVVLCRRFKVTDDMIERSLLGWREAGYATDHI